LLATAGNGDLISLDANASALTLASASAAWVTESAASHYIWKGHNRFNSIKKLCQPIVIEPGDDNKVIVSYHTLVNVSHQYQVIALYTPTFWLSLLSITLLHTAGYRSTFGPGKSYRLSPSITITGNRVNNL
jgi:hypothetical protein